MNKLQDCLEFSQIRTKSPDPGQDRYIGCCFFSMTIYSCSAKSIFFLACIFLQLLYHLLDQ